MTGRSTEKPLENLIVIGASAGGHKALREVLKNLSPDIPAAVIIMQHLPSQSPLGADACKLGDYLHEYTAIPIVKIQQEERLRSGAIYIGPPGMSVWLNGRALQIAPYERGAGPATTINILFESAAKQFRDRVIGVILTGLLKDGTVGLKAVHDAGGITIVQDPKGAEYPQMPASAMKDLPVTFCLNLSDIGATLDLLARRKTNLETGLALSIRALKERVALLVRLLAQSKGNPDTYRFLSTEMIALELDLRSVQALLDHALIEEGRRRDRDRKLKP